MHPGRRAILTILGLSLAGFPVAGQPLAPEVLTLARASGLVRDTVDALADCVCLESVSRVSVDQNAKIRREDPDTLQIEATTIGNREWFSWLGRNDTFTESPAALVGHGMMNTGQLTSNLKTVFLDGVGQRKFRGNEKFHGRQALRFDYAIGSAFMHFSIRGLHGSVTAGLKGSFWIDPESAELLALYSEATEIPDDFEIRSVGTEVIYTPVFLGGRRVALPQEATTYVEHAARTVSINDVEFSHCRPYSTSSSIRFDTAPPAPAALPEPPGSREEQPIPAGLSLALRFEEAIGEQAVGDRLGLILETDARSNGATVIRKGARVEGRLRRLETTNCPERCMAVAIELLSVVAADGVRRPVYASLRQVAPSTRVKLDVSNVTRKLAELPFSGQRFETSGLSIDVPQIPGVGAFLLLATDLTTLREVLMTWVTENPRQP